MKTIDKSLILSRSFVALDICFAMGGLSILLTFLGEVWSPIFRQFAIGPLLESLVLFTGFLAFQFVIIYWPENDQNNVENRQPSGWQ